ncbi:Mitochondrial substrate carrier family protein M [Thelohanellus kitauei]|uniref:Mitochondrial substrate carrier family protein M n=1 Tax=Thelohanellus kitauei TaxID=669202 RepID=A0A0C2MAW5_THEKT|nr:Mitochondrial substrate carrier family protein M [Thelohanellus kitauei]
MRDPNIYERVDWKHFLAGSFAAAMATVTMHPLDVLKARAQVGYLEKDGKFEKYIKNIRYIWRTQGFIGFYKGLTPNVIGHALAWGISMHFFHTSRQTFLLNTGSDKVPLSADFVFATIATMIVAVGLNPIWVVKLKMSTNKPGGIYTGVFKTIFAVYKKSGICGFYSGVTFGILASVHSGLLLTFYEHAKVLLQYLSGTEELTGGQNVIASTVSKCMACVITYPFQMMKSRVQHRRGMNTPQSHKEIFKDVWGTGRVFSFYRGIFSSTWRLLPALCLNLYLFEEFRKKIGRSY